MAALFAGKTSCSLPLICQLYAAVHMAALRSRQHLQELACGSVAQKPAVFGCAAVV